MARSVALEINGFTNIFEQTSPDFVLLLGIEEKCWQLR